MRPDVPECQPGGDDEPVVGDGVPGGGVETVVVWLKAGDAVLQPASS